MADPKQDQKQDLTTNDDHCVPQEYPTWPRVGSFSYFSAEDRWHWSEAVSVMHGYPAEPMQPSTETVLGHNHPDDTYSVGQLVEQLREQGTPFSSRHRIVDANGRTRLVVVVGDRCYGRDGDVVGTTGFYVDITEEFDADLQRTLDGIVDGLARSRAVINQAIGMLMLIYGISGERAFDVLAWRSSETNVKLRDIAARVVARAGAGDIVSTRQRTMFDHVLLNAHSDVVPAPPAR